MAKTSVIVIGTGGMARSHIRQMLDRKRSTSVVGFVEVSEKSRAATRAWMEERGCACPPFYDSIKALVKAQGAADAAVIVTPHKFHLENTSDCLKAGMDVLLEKPMVLNAGEARRLIRVQKATKRLLVVAFPGSLSPAIRKAKELIKKGTLGKITAVNAWAHQHWKRATKGTWRQVPEVSGGGFLFDTGSHMVNTVVDLIGEPVTEVTALLDHCGTPVEINSSVGGRFKGGAMFTMTGAGDSIFCQSGIQIFGDKGVLETGIWGERLRLMTLKKREFEPVPYPKYTGVWEQFEKVRGGRQKNPCPPEVGLRFSLLMDMIRKSAATGKKVRARR